MLRRGEKIRESILFSKRFFLLKHYQIFWSPHLLPFNRQAMTPLFKITIYRNVSLSKTKTAVIFNCNYWKNAARQQQISIHRTAILKVLNQNIKKLTPTTLVTIYLLPTSALVPSDEISRQLDHLFKSKILFFQNFTKPNKLQTQLKDKILQSSQHELACFSHLFPYNHNSWLQYMKKQTLLKDFNKINVFSWTAVTKITARAHWILAHHYKIYYCTSPVTLGADLSNLLKLLKKFNFFAYFGIPQVHSFSGKNHQAICLRFIRCLQWKSKESQDYIQFLIKTHNVLDIFTILQDFQTIFNSFRKEQLGLYNKKVQN